jgi:osmotically-inducible protein OsmY
MTSPAVTTTPETPVVEAARTSAVELVRRMPVVDTSGVLDGIVTRTDLLSVFDRNDDEILAHIMDDILCQDLGINPLTVRVTVRQGVVTLSGELEKESRTRLVVAAVRATIGVAHVKNELSYRVADVPPTPVTGPIY